MLSWNNTLRITLMMLGLINTTPIIAATNEKSTQLFIQNCMVCHANDGGGAMPGIADLTENRVWSVILDKTLLARMKQGIQTPSAAVTMPPKRGQS